MCEIGYQGCPLHSSKYIHGEIYHLATRGTRVKALVLYRGILLACNFVAEVAALRCEVRVLAQVLNPAEEELELPECGGGCVLRNLLIQISVCHVLRVAILRLTMCPESSMVTKVRPRSVCHLPKLPAPPREPRLSSSWYGTKKSFSG